MAIDIDDVMTEAFDAVERAMRTRVADALTEVLTNVVDEVDGAESTGEDYATENYAEDDSVMAEIATAWDAGFARALELLREAIESAKFTGWRPAPAE